MVVEKPQEGSDKQRHAMAMGGRNEEAEEEVIEIKKTPDAHGIQVFSSTTRAVDVLAHSIHSNSTGTTERSSSRPRRRYG